MVKFDIQVLKTEELSEAWAAVRSGPYANIDWWFAEGADLIASGGGVLVARAPSGAVHGVAAFKVGAGPARKRVLRIPLLISLELSPDAPAEAALLAALERIAMRLECSHVVLPLVPKLGPLWPSESWCRADDQNQGPKRNEVGRFTGLRTIAERQGFGFRRT